MRSMAEELLDRVLRELRERKARAQAAWEESRRLEAALEALEADRGRTQPDRPPRARGRPSSSRAPRGQTREAILRAIGERPGTTAAEIAAVACLDRRVTQSTLARLVRQGALERYSPPGGGSAYRLPSPTRDPVTANVAAPASGDAEKRESAAAKSAAREDAAAGAAVEKDEREGDKEAAAALEPPGGL
jgi:hypothetical protein